MGSRKKSIRSHEKPKVIPLFVSKKEIHETTIIEKIWELPDDLYYVVPEIQVFNFKKGQRVKITIEPAD